MDNDNEVRKKLLALQQMKGEELRGQWRTLYNTEPPLYSDVFMRKRLAYRIQELAYGGLDEATRERIDSVNGKVRRKADWLRLGTMLVREWHDVKYEVKVISNGFEWNGGIYGSLSAVARAITGVNRNGFTFFGVKPENLEKQQ